jgi:hypothetical protein
LAPLVQIDRHRRRTQSPIVHRVSLARAHAHLPQRPSRRHVVPGRVFAREERASQHRRRCGARVAILGEAREDERFEVRREGRLEPLRDVASFVTIETYHDPMRPAPS